MAKETQTGALYQPRGMGWEGTCEGSSARLYIVRDLLLGSMTHGKFYIFGMKTLSPFNFRMSCFSRDTGKHRI